MVRRDRFLLATAPRWQQLTLVCLLVGLVAGCGKSMSPEQRAAFIKVQTIGGRVNYRNGGYEVDLSKTLVSDADLVHLQKISNLKSLDLRETPITDAGVERLRSIKSLTFVGLPRAGVTAGAAESLRKSLPDATVMH